MTITVKVRSEVRLYSGFIIGEGREVIPFENVEFSGSQSEFVKAFASEKEVKKKAVVVEDYKSVYEKYKINSAIIEQYGEKITDSKEEVNE